jgi:hypothetical protein
MGIYFEAYGSFVNVTGISLSLEMPAVGSDDVCVY